MFGGRFSSSCGVLGVDIGSRSIRMLQLRAASGGALDVVGAAEEPLNMSRALRESADGEEASVRESDETGESPSRSDQVTSPIRERNLAERLRATFAAGGFAGRRCVVSLPREDMHVQAIRLPRMPETELRQAAVWEAAERFGFDTQDMEVDVLRTGASLQSGEAREEVLLVAASHAAINRWMKPILDAGLRPIAIDTHFGALARILSRYLRRESDQKHVRAVVEVGSSGTTIMILRGDQIAFCKPITIGGREFNQAVADHLQLDLDAAAELRAARMNAELQANLRLARMPERGLRDGGEGDVPGKGASDPSTDRAIYEAARPLLGELVKEVTLCLRYYGVTFRGKPPYQIILAGGDALEPHLAEMLSTACKLPVVFDDEQETLARLAEPIEASLHRMLRFPGSGIGLRGGLGAVASWSVAAGLSIRELERSQRSMPQPEVSSAAHQVRAQDSALRKGAA